MAAIDQLEAFLGQPRTYAEIKKWAEGAGLAEDIMGLCMDAQKAGKAVRTAREGALPVFHRPDVKVEGAKAKPPDPGLSPALQAIKPKREPEEKPRPRPAPIRDLIEESGLREVIRKGVAEAEEREQIERLTRPPAKDVDQVVQELKQKTAAAGVALKRVTKKVERFVQGGDFTVAVSQRTEATKPAEENEMAKETMTNEEAGRALGGITPGALGYLRTTGKLKGERDFSVPGGPFMWDRASVEKLVAQRANGEKTPKTRALVPVAAKKDPGKVTLAEVKTALTVDLRARLAFIVQGADLNEFTLDEVLERLRNLVGGAANGER